MKPMTETYRIPQLPDPFDPRLQIEAGGDVRKAIFREGEFMLRAIADFPPASVSASIRLIYQPPLCGSDPRSRLRLYFSATAHNVEMADSLFTLLQQGPLQRFYRFEPEEAPPLPWNHLKALCDVVRREGAVTPLYGAEFNDRIPPFYYTLESFEPSVDNDFLRLERTLGGVTEEVLIEIRIEPVDISAEHREHSAYLARLQSINRSRDREDNPDPDEMDCVDRNWASSLGGQRILKPLRCPDPLADDILRIQRRFHEVLRKPHLQFGARILAETQPTARMLGSVLAESAFESGSYRLVSSKEGDRGFNRAVSRQKNRLDSSLSTHESLFNKGQRPFYRRFERLAHVAPAEELSGLFRLPLASYGSPWCIPKNTDPKPAKSDDFILIGKEYPL